MKTCLFSNSPTGNGDKTKPSLLHQTHALAIHATSAIVMPSLMKTKRATNELVLCYSQAWDLSVERPVTPVARGQTGQLCLNSLILLACRLLKLQRWLSQSGPSWFLQHSPLVIQSPLFSTSLRHSSLSLLPGFEQSLQESCVLVYSDLIYSF